MIALALKWGMSPYKAFKRIMEQVDMKAAKFAFIEGLTVKLGLDACRLLVHLDVSKFNDLRLLLSEGFQSQLPQCPLIDFAISKLEVIRRAVSAVSIAWTHVVWGRSDRTWNRVGTA